MEIDRQVVISPSSQILGQLTVPGDKSISHRALLVTALASGPAEIHGLSPAGDVRSSLATLNALGVRTLDSQGSVERQARSSSHSDFQIMLERPVEGLVSPGEPLDVGNSGSTIRMLLGILAGGDCSATMTGDASIRRRPMGRVIEPLRAMGALISTDHEGYAPVKVRGTRLLGRDHDLKVASAQVKSALLFAGLQAEGSTSVYEPTRSRDHTERLLRYLGVPVEEQISRLIVKSTELRNGMVWVPGDLSSAAFLLVAAAIRPGSHLRVDDVGVNPTRTGILEILSAFGAEVVVSEVMERSGEPRGAVSVRSAERRAFEVSGSLTVDAIDELPLVAVLGCYAEGETVVRGAAELRIKESDRIDAICTGLRLMGADIEALPDGFVVRGPSKLKGAEVDSAGDHRIAMALAVAALGADGPTTISGWDAVGVSYPGFERDLARVAVP